MYTPQVGAKTLEQLLGKIGVDAQIKIDGDTIKAETILQGIDFNLSFGPEIQSVEELRASFNAESKMSYAYSLGHPYNAMTSFDFAEDEITVGPFDKPLSFREFYNPENGTIDIEKLYIEIHNVMGWVLDANSRSTGTPWQEASDAVNALPSI